MMNSHAADVDSSLTQTAIAAVGRRRYTPAKVVRVQNLRRLSPMRLAGQTWKILVCLALFAGTIDLLNHLIGLTLGIEGSFGRAVIRVGIWWISYVPLLACALVLADRYRLDG